MHIFEVSKEQEFSPHEHVENILAKLGGGDVTVACWEPGQISPYHCHPEATEIYFCFQGGGRMRTPEQIVDVTPGSFVVHPPGEVHEYENGGKRTLLFRVRYGSDLAARHADWRKPGWKQRPEDADYFRRHPVVRQLARQAGRRDAMSASEQQRMQVFDITKERAFTRDKLAKKEKILGNIADGDFSVVYWEPGQISPYHCHPDATEIYFWFRGGGRMRTAQTITDVTPGSFVVHPPGELHEFENGVKRTQVFRVRYGKGHDRPLCRLARQSGMETAAGGCGLFPAQSDRVIGRVLRCAWQQSSSRWRRRRFCAARIGADRAGAGTVEDHGAEHDERQARSGAEYARVPGRRAQGPRRLFRSPAGRRESAMYANTPAVG
jgi:quercetin dioxygenase-like cupin family protein